jgi:two-component system, LytTR family, sensor kinase
MTTAPGPRLMNRTTAWLAGFGVWTLLALLSSVQSVIFLNSIDREIQLGPILFGRLTDWYTCAVFTPVYFWLVRRYPIDRGTWPVSLPVHLVTTSIFVVLKYVMHLEIMSWVESAGVQRSLADTLAGNFIFESIAFWCVLGVVHAIVFYERYRDREIAAAQLQAQLSASQLEALSAQLHPHFLFNTLQGVSTLMHRDPQGADTMLNRLSELLRRTLHRGERQEVSLGEEMELLGYYVGIMQVRFGDRLVFESEIDPLVREAMVPHFILQPLVENALQHGVARRAGAGKVTVEATRRGDSTVLTIRDDGPAREPGQGDVAEGIGLGNTRLRLERLYGSNQSLTMTPIVEGGMQVELVLPFRGARA